MTQSAARNVLAFCRPPGQDPEVAEWVKRDFTKGDVDRAGEFLARWWRSVPDVSEEQRSGVGKAWVIADNWRTCHAYPLNSFQVNLRSRARRVEDGVLVAQRLKRMTSVLNKLAREPHMKLSQMQDLGGCRGIFSSVDSVYDTRWMYGGHQSLFDTEGTLKCDDYIREPKPDGYRGIHIVGRFAARSEIREDWNGQRIEVQLRTRLQHAFATAVETVTTFTREPLKFGGGPEKWKRFFSLMGSALAIRENTEFVPGTPTTRSLLVKELRESARDLTVKSRLRGWSKALTTLPSRNMAGFKWLLLALDTEANTMKVTGYDDRQKASEALTQLEQRKSANLDSVLVWLPSARDLRKAYPNYYADTREFIDALDAALKVGA